MKQKHNEDTTFYGETLGLDVAVGALAAKGVTFERYEGMQHQDEKGIARGLSHDMGPDIAWFTDPAGNILSVLQDTKRS